MQDLNACLLEGGDELGRIASSRFHVPHTGVEDHLGTNLRLDAQLGQDGEIYAEGLVGQGAYPLDLLVKGLGRCEAVGREKTESARIAHGGHQFCS
ncbi:hypothetical protein D3C85_1201380 [compost metagenome]